MAVYSILGDQVEQAKVLDAYAGSGAFGLEALSRGAANCTFVDSNHLAIEAIEANLKNAHFWGKAKAIKSDAMRFLAEDTQLYDLIFVCPPYSYGLPDGLFFHLAEHLSPEGVVVIDHARTTVIKQQIEGLEIVDQRTYGASGVTFLRHAENDNAD